MSLFQLLIYPILHLIVNALLLKIIIDKSNDLRCMLLQTYNNPIVMMLLSSIHLSTGSLKDVISMYKIYNSKITKQDTMCNVISKQGKNPFLMKNMAEIFEGSLIQQNFRDLITKPNVILTNFNEFLKTMDIVYSYGENYISDLDDRLSLIIFTFFFLPFIITQLQFLFINTIIALFVTLASQTVLLLHIYKFLKNKIDNFSDIRGSVYA